jgi:hypothetical protein
METLGAHLETTISTITTIITWVCFNKAVSRGQLMNWANTVVPEIKVYISILS